MRSTVMRLLAAILGSSVAGLVNMPAVLGADQGPVNCPWVEPMRKVHARFTGSKGTLACFGDSITVTMAFWAPLAYQPKDMPTQMVKDLALVKDSGILRGYTRIHAGHDDRCSS